VTGYVTSTGLKLFILHNLRRYSVKKNMLEFLLKHKAQPIGLDVGHFMIKMIS